MSGVVCLFCVSRPPARGLLLWIPGAGEAGLRRAVCAKIPFAMITIDSPLERVNYPDRITGGSRGPRPREVRSEGAA